MLATYILLRCRFVSTVGVLCQSAQRRACDLSASGNVDAMLRTAVHVIEMYSVGSDTLVYEENFPHAYVDTCVVQYS